MKRALAAGMVLAVLAAAAAYAAGGGIITLNGATSGTVTVQVPAVAGSTTFQLPGDNGTSGYVLSTDGTGVTSWVANGGGGAAALSSITSAITVHSFDNTSMAQTWTWNSLTTQTAFTLSSSSLTNGNILSLQNKAAAATATGHVLDISNTTTGAGYGVYSAMTGHGNTGYAGYFVNTDTSANQNFGIAGIALGSNANTAGVYAESDQTNTQAVYALSNNGYGVFAIGGMRGVTGITYGTSSSAGIEGQENGAANTGYAGLFTNTATTGVNYGIYGTDASSSGYGGYFSNTSTGWALNATGTSYFNGSVGIGTTNLNNSTLEVNGQLRNDGNVFLGSGAGDFISLETHNNTASSIYIGDVTTAAIYIPTGTSTGSRRVGIGTSSPAGQLEVDNTTAGNTGYAGYFANTATTANYGIYVTSATKGAGYGVYSSMAGHGNTGYAGYFINTDTSNNLNYGIYAAGGSEGYGVLGTSLNNVGVFGQSTNNLGILAQGPNAFVAQASGTGVNYGVNSQITGAANTGYAGYFSNTGTGAINYGIYATTSSATGYAGFFQGAVKVSSSITTAGCNGCGGVIGDVRNAKMSITAATTTGSFSADQIVAATALNGTMYDLVSYSQTINLGTTGAGGMDTGSAPASGFVSLYAIYNPTTPATSILACAVATSTNSVYGGANMPSGYTASALIGIWPTNSSRQFVPGLIFDRHFQYQSYVSIFTGTSGVSNLTSRSISAGVPAAARTADIALASTQTGGSNWYGAVSSDSTGTGAIGASFPLSSGVQNFPGGLGSTYKGMASLIGVPLITAQTVYWNDSNGNSGDAMFVQGYSF
jgi:hypothetical protein